MSIRHMDPIFFDIVETLIDIDAGLRLSANQVDGFERRPWPIALGQLFVAIAYDKSKDATDTSKNFDLHLIPVVTC